MAKVRVAAFSLSVDGFGAGPEQSLNDPLGKRGTELHQWAFGTRTFQAMFGKEGGSLGVDNDYGEWANVNIALLGAGGVVAPVLP